MPQLQFKKAAFEKPHEIKTEYIKALVTLIKHIDFDKEKDLTLEALSLLALEASNQNFSARIFNHINAQAQSAFKKIFSQNTHPDIQRKAIEIIHLCSRNEQCHNAMLNKVKVLNIFLTLLKSKDLTVTAPVKKQIFSTVLILKSNRSLARRQDLQIILNKINEHETQFNNDQHNDQPETVNNHLNANNDNNNNVNTICFNNNSTQEHQIETIFDLISYFDAEIGNELICRAVNTLIALANDSGAKKMIFNELMRNGGLNVMRLLHSSKSLQLIEKTLALIAIFIEIKENQPALIQSNLSYSLLALAKSTHATSRTRLLAARMFATLGAQPDAFNKMYKTTKDAIVAFLNAASLLNEATTQDKNNIKVALHHLGEPIYVTLNTDSNIDRDTDQDNEAPDHGKESFGLAIAYLHSKQYKSALAAYNEVLTLEPNNSDALWGKGEALFYLNRHEEALLVFKDIKDDVYHARANQRKEEISQLIAGKNDNNNNDNNNNVTRPLLLVYKRKREQEQTPAAANTNLVKDKENNPEHLDKVLKKD
jgi:tetratricopeptide (TPR) repeat protein